VKSPSIIWCSASSIWIFCKSVAKLAYTSKQAYAQQQALFCTFTANQYIQKVKYSQQISILHIHSKQSPISSSFVEDGENICEQLK
jgi:hypothetical protein